MLRATLERRGGGPIPGPVSPIEFAIGDRCIRHGQVALMAGHGIDSNITMNLLGLELGSGMGGGGALG